MFPTACRSGSRLFNIRLTPYILRMVQTQSAGPTINHEGLPPHKETDFSSLRKDMPDKELRPLYLDAQATTSLDPRVLDAMLPYMVSYYGNPHSRTHAYGWETEAAVEKARKQVADCIGADPREIIFTSGATESNNISVKGTARFYKSKKKHVITTQTEHKCVLDSCRALEGEGFEITYLPVNTGQNGPLPKRLITKTDQYQNGPDQNGPLL